MEERDPFRTLWCQYHEEEMHRNTGLDLWEGIWDIACPQAPLVAVLLMAVLYFAFKVILEFRLCCNATHFSVKEQFSFKTLG